MLTNLMPSQYKIQTKDFNLDNMNRINQHNKWLSFKYYQPFIVYRKIDFDQIFKTLLETH